GRRGLRGRHGTRDRRSGDAARSHDRDARRRSDCDVHARPPVPERPVPWNDGRQGPASRQGAGAAPAGAVTLRSALATPEGKRRYVRHLFATIADRYDLITRVLSYGLDRRWKRRLLRLARAGAGDRVLDLACGTGDLLFGMRRARLAV